MTEHTGHCNNTTDFAGAKVMFKHNNWYRECDTKICIDEVDLGTGLAPKSYTDTARGGKETCPASDPSAISPFAVSVECGNPRHDEEHNNHADDACCVLSVNPAQCCPEAPDAGFAYQTDKRN